MPIAALGAFPTACIFRPTEGFDLEHWPTPNYSEMRTVVAHVYEACCRHWLPGGAAPNIEVSLIVRCWPIALPGSMPMRPTASGRIAAGPMFNRRMRPTR